MATPDDLPPMAAPEELPHPHTPPVWLRHILGVVLAGSVGGIVFLTIAQEAFKKGFTTHRFNGSMGIYLGGHAEQIARRGLYGTLVIGLVLALAYLVVRRFMRGPEWLRGIQVGIVAFLGWGAVFGPLAKGSNTVPAGFFGLDADAAAPVVILVAALAGCLTLVRVYDLALSATWWQPRHVDFEASVHSLVNEGELEVDKRVIGGEGKHLG